MIRVAFGEEDLQRRVVPLYIVQDLPSSGTSPARVAVLTHQHSDGDTARSRPELVWAADTTPDGVVSEVEPTAWLPVEALAPLAAALARKLGDDPGDAAALRRDYNAERARVDKLIDHVLHLAGVVTGTAALDGSR